MSTDSLKYAHNKRMLPDWFPLRYKPVRNVDVSKKYRRPFKLGGGALERKTGSGFNNQDKEG